MDRRYCTLAPIRRSIVIVLHVLLRVLNEKQSGWQIVYKVHGQPKRMTNQTFSRGPGLEGMTSRLIDHQLRCTTSYDNLAKVVILIKMVPLSWGREIFSLKSSSLSRPVTPKSHSGFIVHALCFGDIDCPFSGHAGYQLVDSKH